MLEPTKEKLESFKNSKYFQNQRFWIIDLVRYEKPVRTSRAIHFERYRDGKVALRSEVYTIFSVRPEVLGMKLSS